MSSPPPQQPGHRFVDTVKRLLRRNASPSLRNILTKIHPADIAQILESFVPEQRVNLLAYAGDLARQAEVVATMPLGTAAELLSAISLEQSVSLLREMSGDDRADILGGLDEELASKILGAMPTEEMDEVAELMGYGENTAGGIMSPDFLAIQGDLSVHEAVQIVRESPDVEMAFYIYAIDDHGSLVGVVSLRQLVTTKPEMTLNQIMNPQVVSVRTSVDQEEVARLVSRYDFLAIPVVDDTNKLVGVITVDDVIDVIRDEATEDFLKMAGAGEGWDDKPSVLGSIRRRAPWLAAAWIGGIVASMIIVRFEDVLNRYVALVGFIPIIIGMAGNVGTQSLTVVVRGLATRRIEVKQFWSVTSKEVATGVLLGILYGAALGVFGFLEVHGSPGINALLVAMVIGGASTVAMVIAALVGSAMPLLLARLHIDPAVATGPFVTTAVDVLGVLVYFNIASAFL